ncbi:MAG: T9SS type A sorting domain-containing protein [Aquaticitalea sp.]
MKKSLLFSILFALSLTLFSQTNTWTGTINNNWGNPANWSLNALPNASNNVVIPTGSTVFIDVSATIKSIAIQGNAEVTMDNSLNIDMASSIAANAIVTWNSGGFYGNGTISNNGTVTLLTAGGKVIGNAATFNNKGTFNFNDGPLTLGYGSPTLNNMASGTINLNTASTIDYSQGIGTLINSGLIKKAQNSGIFEIQSMFTNNNGTISVESGTLRLNYSNASLIDGIYNVTSGNTLEWANGFTLLGTLTGQLDGQINWTGNLNIEPSTEAILNFMGPTGVNWTSGSFGGNGIGTLTNRGILNLVSTTGKAVTGQSILKNEGTIKFNGTGSLTLGFGSPILNNTVSGIINLNSDSAFDFQQGIGTLVNTGLIRKKQSSGTFNIYCMFQNNDGKISVEAGTLKLNYSNSILTDGIYNVTSGNTLEWANGFTLLGTLTGQLDGQINWTGNLNVEPTTEAILNFTGSTGVNWTSGSFGGNGIGTLTNKGALNVISATGKSIGGQSILNNEGTINYNGTGVLTLGFGSPTFNNAAIGIVNLNVNSAFDYQSGIGTVINQGLIKKEQSTGTFNIYVNTNNMSPGIIICENGLLNFGTYIGDGTLGGHGSVQLPANTTFDGTIAPGSSPGILTYLGSFIASPNAILAIEINGPNSGTDYDVFNIQGNAVMNGVVDLSMGYAANINDEFIVATTSGTISQCNLAPSTSGDFNGMTYTFDVFCRNDNQVVLKVVNVALGINDFELSASNIQLFPNPVRNILTLKNVKQSELKNGQIMDVTGKIIHTFDLKEMGLTKEISMENYASGMYFVKINALNGSVTKRIVKE